MTQRVFLPGSEWLYLKIYCNEMSAAAILLNRIKPLLAYVRDKEPSATWFFIRYRDESGFHLRARFHIVSKILRGLVMERVNALFSPLLDSKEVWKIELGTYVRELERYRSDDYQLVESLFCYDSDCVLTILDQSREQEAKFKWLACTCMIMAYFRIAKIDLPHIVSFISGMREAFRSEFGCTSPEQLRPIKSLVRKRRQDFASLDGWRSFNRQIDEALRLRESQLTGLCGNSKLGLENFRYNLPDYIHMSINRIANSENRFCEFVLYEHLYTYYKSLLCRTH